MEAIKRCASLEKEFSPHMRIFQGNFRDLDKILDTCSLNAVDGILFDLGISSFQIDGERGFSFQRDEPLDMRMDRRDSLTAADLVNTLPRRELKHILYHYGEEKNAALIARAIDEEREKKKIVSTGQLRDIILKAASWKDRKIHPATKTFMALRIILNKELEVLEEGLVRGFKYLKSGGRLVVISFHSLEDRIVKRFFKDLTKNCRCPKERIICNCGGRPLARLINKKPVYPGTEEKNINPRSRSARLRAVEKL